MIVDNNPSSQYDQGIIEPSISEQATSEQTISEQPSDADVQLESLKHNALAAMATLRSQEQHKLQQALAQMQPLPTGEPQANATAFDGMLIKDRLLDPLKGLDKIQGVHNTQLNRIIERIKDTLDSGPSTDKEASDE